MRWSFRRRTTPAPRRVRAASPRQESAKPLAPKASAPRPPVRSGSPGPVGATRSASGGPAPSLPRFDWAHLPPLERTVSEQPPLTFHGDRFGRNVAGGRSMTTAMSHRRPQRGGTAPSGLMLDIAEVETIEPVPERSAPELPPVHPPSVAPVHRHVPSVPRRPTDEPLTSADIDVGFEPAPERDRPLPTTMAWTIEGGFIRDSSAGTEPAGPSDTAGTEVGDGESEPRPDEPFEAKLRYVPTTEPRIERPTRDVVDLVQQVTGHDVGDTVIDRSPAVSDRADQLGAVAFTEQGTVHLPAELGDMDDPAVRGVVAHELTHVAQQRSRGSEVPSEESAEGRALENQAKAVQRATSGAVRPTVVRRSSHVPDARAGVQRLADDGRYDWQGRDGEDEDGDDDELSPSETRAALGLFQGYSWGRGSVGDRILRREDENDRHRWEVEHRDELLDARREHYDDILDRRLELKRARAPEDSRDVVELSRRDVIEARVQLDRDMPFEFELPDDVDPYPGELPELGPDDDLDDLDDLEGRHDSTWPDAPYPPRRAPVTGGPPGYGAGPAARSLAMGGRTRGGRDGRGRPGGRSERQDPSAAFEWQEREPTDQQAVQALFGGGLLGDLLGRAVGEETDEDRREAEEARLPDLLAERKKREQELRHRALHDKLRMRATVARREEQTPERTPISLTDEEITSIREQIDADMPLQFAVPDYLDPDVSGTIDAEGTISDGRVDEVADDEVADDEVADDAGEAEDGETTGDEEGAGETEPAPDLDLSGADARADAGADAGAEDADADQALDGDATFLTGDEDLQPVAAPTAGRATSGSLMTAATLARADEMADVDDDDLGDEAQSAASEMLSAASDQDIDALSRLIWDRIRREMRSELLVDRERAGALADHR